MRRSASSWAGALPVGKPLAFSGSSLDDLRAFHEAARRAAGRQLWRVQHGVEPLDWKPIAAVGSGAIEIRIHGGTEHRVFVVTKFVNAIHVMHAFEKTSQGTPRRDIEIARRRYQALLEARRGGSD